MLLILAAVSLQQTAAGRPPHRRCGRPSAPLPASSAAAAGPAATAPAGGRPSPAAAVRLFDGRTLQGWKIPERFTFDAHGPVRVRDGRIELGAGSPATGIVWAAEPPRMDYELNLEAMRTEGSDFFCGVTFPVGPQSCSLIVGGWGGGLVGLSNVDGMPANENETTSHQRFTQHKWYRIRLRVQADRIEVWIDDRQVIQLPTADREFSIWWEQEPLQPLGIATWYTAAALRNITLRRLGRE